MNRYFVSYSLKTREGIGFRNSVIEFDSIEGIEDVMTIEKQIENSIGAEIVMLLSISKLPM